MSNSTSPAPEQVRAAADIIEALNVSMEMHPNSHWRPAELRAEAGRIAEDQRAASEKAAPLVVQLADELAGLRFAGSKFDDLHRDEQSEVNVLAAHLIESGWRKGDSHG